MSEDENKIEMTEGEAIELLKEYVAYTKQARSPYETDKATEMLLDLYEQEKEKNKFINEIKTIGTDDTIQVVLTKSQYSFLLNKSLNSVSKDKIKERIKELEGQEAWYREHNSLDELYGRIDELEELLKD